MLVKGCKSLRSQAQRNCTGVKMAPSHTKLNRRIDQTHTTKTSRGYAPIHQKRIHFINIAPFMNLSIAKRAKMA